MPLNANEAAFSHISLIQVAALPDAYGPPLAFSSDGRTWASVDGGLIHLWEDLQRLHTISLLGGAPGPIHFSTDGHLLFAGTAIIDLNSQQPQSLPPLAESLIAARISLRSTAQPGAPTGQSWSFTASTTRFG